MFGAIFFMSAILVAASAEDTTADGGIGTNIVKPMKEFTGSASKGISSVGQAAVDMGKSESKYVSKLVSSLPVVGPEAGKIFESGSSTLDGGNTIFQSMTSLGENFGKANLNVLEASINSVDPLLKTFNSSKNANSSPFLSLFSG